MVGLGETEAEMVQVFKDLLKIGCKFLSIGQYLAPSGEFEKVDTDKQKELSAAMGIQSLPTIIFIPKTGQPQIIIGAANKTTFRKAIEEVLLKE